MEPSDLILLTLGKTGRVISGRTALQKTVYFASLRIHKDLGYKAHFYGPYSPLVAKSIDFLVQTDFIHEEERVPAPEYVQYSYSLTQDGAKAAATSKNEHPAEAREIEKVVQTCEEQAGNDVRILSFAAKVYFLVKEEGDRRWTPREILDKASSIGWEMTPEQARKGVDLLVTLGLGTMGPSG